MKQASTAPRTYDMVADLASYVKEHGIMPEMAMTLFQTEGATDLYPVI
jgi:hypothetical protein